MSCALHVTLETIGKGLDDIAVMAFRTFEGKLVLICIYLAFSRHRLKSRLSSHSEKVKVSVCDLVKCVRYCPL